MIGLEVPHRVGFRYLAAALDELVGRGAQLLQPVVADDALEEDVALVEVELALRLGQHARRSVEDLLGCHCGLLYLIESITLGSHVTSLGKVMTIKSATTCRQMKGITPR